LGVIVAVAATYLALDRQTPLYRSTATIQVGRAIQETNPDPDDLAVAERLTPAYAEMAKRDPVLDAAVATLGLSMDADAVRDRLVVMPVTGTQLIDIAVVDADPEVAAGLATEIARQLQQQGPSTETEDTSQAFIQDQLDDLQTKIVQSQDAIVALEADIAEMTNAADIYDAQERITALTAQIDSWQETYGTLLSQSEPSTTNIVRVVNQATPATTPIPTGTLYYYGLAAVLGASLGALAGLVLNVLGGALRRPAELEPIVGRTPLVTIPRYRVPRTGTPVSAVSPMSDASASYRVLRNVIRSVTPPQRGATIVVTSGRAGEGKTTTAANLSIALSNSGLRVILVDANLRYPELGTLFDMDDYPGLADALMHDVTVEEVVRASRQPRLSIVTGGSPLPNFADLLASPQLSAVVNTLARQADVVVFDTPAILQEQETTLLAKGADCVIVVAESGQVRGKDLERTLELLEHAEAPAGIIVLNKLRVPHLSRERLPWSREARLRARRSKRQRKSDELALRTPAPDAGSAHIAD
jgi:capsular exopolysaccharide synthesis family protein